MKAWLPTLDASLLKSLKRRGYVTPTGGASCSTYTPDVSLDIRELQPRVLRSRRSIASGSFALEICLNSWIERLRKVGPAHLQARFLSGTPSPFRELLREARGLPVPVRPAAVPALKAFGDSSRGSLRAVQRAAEPTWQDASLGMLARLARVAPTDGAACLRGPAHLQARFLSGVPDPSREPLRGWPPERPSGLRFRPFGHTKPGAANSVKIRKTSEPHPPRHAPQAHANLALLFHKAMDIMGDIPVRQVNSQVSKERFHRRNHRSWTGGFR
ncbi:hypothetical protein SCOR_24115 [Sulfidibacter corallicola]